MIYSQQIFRENDNNLLIPNYSNIRSPMKNV